MFDPQSIDNLASRLADNIPKGFQDLKADLEKSFRAVLQSALSNMDIVSREEFDVQSTLLARTRQKLEMLESQVEQLEKQLLDK